MKSLIGFLLGAYHALLVEDLNLSLDYITLEKRVAAEGLSFLTVTLPKMGKVFDRALGDGQYSCSSFPAFKPAKNSATPRFLGSLFQLVFDKEGCLRSDAQADAVRSIRQVLYLSYKVDAPYAPEKEARVFADFLGNEEDLRNMCWESVDKTAERMSKDPALLLAQLCTRDLFPNVLRDYYPQHGPGSVSNASSLDKHEAKLTPGSPAYSIHGQSFWFNTRDAFDRLDRHPTWNTTQYFHRKDLSAKIVFVPKDSRGPRLISCEPLEHMFIQQGIMRYMYRVIESSPLTGGSIFFRSNAENQRLALEASADQEWSTLDLKDASDRVHLGLVKVLFSGTTLLVDMLACRTDRTVYDGREIILSKWAPMGSALCFPILAYCCFILLYCNLVVRGVDPGEAKASIRVFGDDIIIKTRYAPWCCDVLESYGLKVNRDKSFINSRFAESCGTDAFDGAVVTPTRLRKLWNIDTEIQKRVPGATAYHLCAVAHGISPLYSNLREHMYASVERICGRPLPYGSDLSYLCRACSETDLSVFMSEYLDRTRVPRRANTFVAFRVLARKSEFEESPYGRLSRVIHMMGMEIDPPKWGETTLPRNSYVTKRRVKIRFNRYR